MLQSNSALKSKIDQLWNKFWFFELWRNAPTRAYDISLFDKNPELKEIIEELFYSETK